MTTGLFPGTRTEISDADVDAAFNSLVWAQLDRLWAMRARPTLPGPAAQPPRRTWATGSGAPAGAPTPNVEMLQRTMDYITANPMEHNQRVWARRSTGQGKECVQGCVAHHAARLAGYQPIWDPEWTNAGGTESGYVRSDSDPTRFTALEVARRALGLTAYQAGRFFEPHNTLDDLWHLAGMITNGQVKRKENV